MPLVRLLGGMSIAFSLPEPAESAIRCRYPASPSSGEAGELFLEADHAGGLRWRMGGFEGVDAHATPSPAVLEAIVVAAHLRRGAVVLHANALAAEGGAILLAGPSGAGKSTLSNLLHRHDPARFRPLAEDVTVLRHGRVQPFPRQPGASAMTAAESTTAFATEPMEVGTVVLLAPQHAASPAETPAGWRLAWIGAPEAPVAAALGAHPFRTPEGVAEVRLDAPPQDAHRAKALAAIRAAGGIVLHAGSLRAAGRSWFRPGTPSVETIATPQGITELNAHRAADPMEPADAAGAWMELAALCGGARFLRCVPGGTPEDSMRALAKALVP